MLLYVSFLFFRGKKKTRYGAQKVAEGVDGAELLTLHEQGLMPLEGGGEDNGEEDKDDEEDVPKLVALPEGMDVEAEEEEEDEEGEQEEEEEEEEDEEEKGGGGRPSKRARREDKKKGVKFASEVKTSDGPGPSGAVDAGPTTKV